MTFIKAFFHRLLLSIGFAAMLPALVAIPLNNMADSQPLYNYHGTDKVYKVRKETEFRFHISPFYQHANTARNGAGKKVVGGDRLGAWNFFGVFFNNGFSSPTGGGATGTSLASKQPLNTNYKTLYDAQTAVGSITTVLPSDAGTIPTNGDAGEADPGAAPSRYRLGQRETTTTYVAGAPGDVTVLESFKLVQPQAPFALVSVPLKYEKIGVRGQLNVDLPLGLGVAIRGGAVNIKNKPGTFVLENKLQVDLGLAALPEDYTPTETSKSDAQVLNKYLFSAEAIDNITTELNYNIRQFRKSSPEDLHAQLYWHGAIACKDKAGDVSVTVIPYVAFGAWIPLSEKFDFDNAFAVPISNQQQSFGATADFSVGFDFPVFPKGEHTTLGFNFGGGALFFNAETQANRRFPSSDLQTGLIPWSAGSVRCQPGATWYLNASMKAEHFVENLSFYADFTYTQHEQDSITVSDSDPAKQRLFQEGVARSQDDSSWKNQQISAGFNYALAPNIAVSTAVQGHISGTRVYRTVTLLGGLTVTF